MRYSARSWRANYQIGERAKDARPATPEPGRRKSAKVIDQDALTAALADLDAQAALPRPMKTGNDLPATGHCHTCDRAVSGERRYCGPCLARRS